LKIKVDLIGSGKTGPKLTVLKYSFAMGALQYNGH